MGGTMLYLDYSKGKTLGALDIPQRESIIRNTPLKKK